MKAAEGVLRDWRPVMPAPSGYFQVLRRSFANGLHVLVLVRQLKDRYLVVSAADHGTLRLSQSNEGMAASVPELIELVRQTCDRRNECSIREAPTGQSAVREYFYAGENGGLAGPVLRETLYDLITSGALTWDAQVWEKSTSVISSGEWQPVLAALGFPPESSDLLSW